MFTHNDWYRWRYEGLADFEWPHCATLGLTTEYAPYEFLVVDLQTACVNNAKSTIDTYPGETFDLMFSGGAESEMVLRSYLQLGHPIRVNVFRYEKDYNSYDVHKAGEICRSLGVRLNVIDFNITRFMENDALTLMEMARNGAATTAAQMSFMDHVDGLPIYGMGDILFQRRSHDDYLAKAEWWASDAEFEISWTRFAQLRRRPAIIEWLKWTPAVLAALIRTKWFRTLIHDGYPGETHPDGTKLLGYREAWPTMVDREKKTGMEYVPHLTDPVGEEWRRRHTEVDTIRGAYNRRTYTPIREALKAFFVQEHPLL